MKKEHAMVEMDDLRRTWADYDRKLDTNIRLSQQLLMAAKLNRVRSPLRRLTFFLGLESLVQFAVVGSLGYFIYQHITALRFAIPAVALDVFAIAILVAMVRQMADALRIDYDQPIALIQKQLGDLRVFRIRYIQGIFLLATLAWTPLLIVSLKGFWNLDAYKLFGPEYLAANVLLGLAIIPLAIWLSRKFGERMGRSPLIQRFMRDLAGYNLNAAAGFLATLAEFADEE
jgi:hypothetical protein